MDSSCVLLALCVAFRKSSLQAAKRRALRRRLYEELLEMSGSAWCPCGITSLCIA
ncbi:hypothetical protein PF005_g10131 [Phytophthora fragariae]|uniref:Uncharacterized protein n=1 Tax=Phytophthora fragariae TaxID=53985 RepID=A0A6A3Y7K7_9STRA|nr:hypothetical protein PF003_g3863 [Phytophthora fragariae]KAE8926512.1 hypothetical protein PF009_g23299 [Phytophthora fragariae]KAE9003108.1 hypothetical protein PF011_g13033 [Phytophthora fragariae]KAE9081109.1 hypothetical protein PF007_g22792 [Phytophthora fragariae]KAE9081964.1 hypothetical protein PF010_g21778 [Phytophthora fragariae]